MAHAPSPGKRLPPASVSSSVTWAASPCHVSLPREALRDNSAPRCHGRGGAQLLWASPTGPRPLPSPHVGAAVGGGPGDLSSQHALLCSLACPGSPQNKGCV